MKFMKGVTSSSKLAYYQAPLKHSKVYNLNMIYICIIYLYYNYDFSMSTLM